jgi:hypothetical protein
MATQATSDFIILGPAMASGDKVLHAVHALYFLPENFKLILTGSKNADQSFFDKVQWLIRHNELGHRVVFADGPQDAHAIILPNTGMARMSGSVAGDSPEALASALLDVFRSRA